MLRKATLADLDFIYTEILAGVGPGHFDKNLSNAITRFFFKRLLRRVIRTQTFTGGKPSCIYIYEIQGIRAGFSSLIYCPDNVCELWLIAITEAFRSRGHGMKLVAETIRLTATPRIYVRCQPASVRMMNILKRIGFINTNSNAEFTLWQISLD
ncbi:GNAT family N-acetyltransferase [Klebsiella michiganensis]|uniref:GNAT family N-acetyltransferase n=1 Tax=Klebsiella michiganensis TaxID=1134687 RepID=UPI003F50CEF3